MTGDWLAKQFFSSAALKMSPEEYAARHAHEWGCFALHHQQFQDSALGAWVRRFGEIFESEAELERCRERFLSPAELAEIKKRQTEQY